MKKIQTNQKSWNAQLARFLGDLCSESQVTSVLGPSEATSFVRFGMAFPCRCVCIVERVTRKLGNREIVSATNFFGAALLRSILKIT